MGRKGAVIMLPMHSFMGGNSAGGRARGAWVLLATGAALAWAGRLAAQDSAGAALARSCAPAKTALVLSGGGAKGLAHIGVLRVLDSLGVKPDIIVGTSVGAVVGGIYASGYSARALDSIARSFPLSSALRSRLARAPNELRGLDPLVMWVQGKRGLSIQSPSVQEPEVNAMLDAVLLRGNVIARGDFDSLPIPFRAIAARISDRGMVVFRSGDLARAVRASMSIPLVFSPVLVDGEYLVDGGLVANVPIEVARQAGATRLIVSDVGGTRDSLDYTSALVIAERLVTFLATQPRPPLGPEDVYIRPGVVDFATLDFAPGRLEQIIKAGVAAADTTLRRAACLAPLSHRVERRVPRHITAVTFRGEQGSLNRLLLRNTLRLSAPGSLDIDDLMRGIDQLGRSGALAALWLNPSGHGDSVAFTIEVEPLPSRMVGLGLVYDGDLGGRVWAGGVQRNIFRSGVSGSVVAALGELERELSVAARPNYQVGRLVSPVGTLSVTDEDVRRFTPAGTALEKFSVRQVMLAGGLEFGTARKWTTVVGLEARWWDPDSLASLATVGAYLKTFRVQPGTGLRQIAVEAGAMSRYQFAALAAEHRFVMGRVALGPRLRLGWGNRLPLQLTFPLGGDDGFPGLHIFERRGDREAYAGLRASYAVVKPLAVHVDLSVGRTAFGGSVVGNGGWLFGGRAGVEVETPIGPVRAAYGITARDRRAWFVRVGRWF